MKLIISTTLLLLAGTVIAAPTPVTAAEPGVTHVDSGLSPHRAVDRRTLSRARYNVWLIDKMNWEKKEAERKAAEESLLETRDVSVGQEAQHLSGRRDLTEAGPDNEALERRFIPVGASVVGAALGLLLADLIKAVEMDVGPDVAARDLTEAASGEQALERRIVHPATLGLWYLIAAIGAQIKYASEPDVATRDLMETALERRDEWRPDTPMPTKQELEAQGLLEMSPEYLEEIARILKETILAEGLENIPELGDQQQEESRHPDPTV